MKDSTAISDSQPAPVKQSVEDSGCVDDPVADRPPNVPESPEFPGFPRLIAPRRAWAPRSTPVAPRAPPGLVRDADMYLQVRDGHITRIEEYLDSAKRSSIKAAREALSG